MSNEQKEAWLKGHFSNVYQSKEDLPSDLRRYHYAPADGVFTFFHHPLYVSIMPVVIPLPIDEFLEERRQRAEKSLEEGNIESYVFIHERAYRMTKLLDLVDDGYFEEPVSPRLAVRFWRLAANVWTDAEFPEDDPCWSRLMNVDIPFRGAMTDVNDRLKIKDMPNEVSVYRGVQAHDDDEEEALEYAYSGWSWTLSVKTARFFARRWIQGDLTPYVIEAKVPKTLFKAYLTSRNEEEVLIDPIDTGNFSVSVKKVTRRHEPR